MKKQAALLFIPIFFASGYFHDYRLPNFSYFTAHNWQIANGNWHFGNPNNDSDNNESEDSDSDEASNRDWNRGHFSWRNYRTHRYDNGANSGTTSLGSTGNTSTNAEEVDDSPTPGVPNTGGDPAAASSTTTTVTPPSPPPLTIFPQPAPPPSNIPPPTTIVNIGNNNPTSPPTPPPPPEENNTATTTPETATSTPDVDHPTPPQPPVTATSTDTTNEPENTNTPPTHTPDTGDIFSTGAVTFRFDDGIQSHYDVAFPTLKSAGFKGTFYIVTHQLLDYGFSGYMSIAEVKELAAAGEDVGDHTQTHPHLTTLSTTAQRAEIAGAKRDLEAMGIEPSTFSYPYGEYTNNTVQVVKSLGFSSAVSTIETAVSKNSDRFQIESPSLQVSDTPGKVEQMIQNAIQNHQWLILTFHDLDTSGDQYSTTPANFREIVDYVKSHNIPVVTVSEGAAQLGH